MKTVKLKSNLQKTGGAFKYRPLPTEFQTNNWFVKIVNISFSLKGNEEINELLTITCNFVTAETYSNSSEIVSYEQPMQMLNLRLTPATKKSCHRFADDILYHVNASSAYLQVNILSEDNNLFTKNVDAYLTLLIGQK